MVELPKTARGSEILELLDRIREARIGPETRMQCKVCWHVYDPAEGCPEAGAEPGTPFSELPGSFTCPDCGQPKEAFLPMDEDEEGL